MIYTCMLKQIRNVFVILFLFVDDKLLTENNLEKLEKNKKLLSLFSINDMGEISYILGVRTIRNCSKKCYFITKELYS